MRLTRTRMGALLLGVLLAPAAGAVGPPQTEVWTRVDTGRIRLVGNVDEGVLLEIAQDLENLRTVMTAVLQPGGRAEPNTTIFVFRNSRSFAFYRDSVIGHRDVRAAGAFVRGDGRNFIAATPGPRNRRSSVLYHELVHDFVSSYIPSAPLWFNEGLAEYFATLEVHDGIARVGLPVREHHQWLMVNTLMPIEDLVAVTNESPEYNERSRHGVFYAQSWALTHYLLVVDGMRSRLQDYLELVGKGIDSDRAFRMAFEHPDAIREELSQYLRRPSFGYFNVPIDAPRITPTVGTLERDEILYELGNLLFFSSEANATAAAEHYRAALRIDPDHAGANSMLGTILYGSGRRREAARHLAKATEASTKDYLPYVLHGEFLLDRARERQITFGNERAPLPEDVARARALFETSTELNPDDSRGWTGLGSTYIFDDGDVGDGIKALKRALQISPDRLDIPVYLVILHLKNGDRKTAKQIIDEQLKPSGDEEKQRLATRALAAADLALADDLAGAGQLDAAIKTIARTISEIDDPALETQLKSDLAEIERILELNRLTELYNEAVRAANDLEYERALAIIDRVIVATRDKTLLADAVELRNRIEQFIEARDRTRRFG